MKILQRKQVSVAIACLTITTCCCLCSAQDGDSKESQASFENKKYSMHFLQQVIVESDVKKELEIVDSQHSEIKSCLADFRKSLDELAIKQKIRMAKLLESDMTELEKERLKSQWNTEIKAQFIIGADDVTKKIENVLLPNQLERLQQIVLQRHLYVKAVGDRTKLFVLLSDELGLSNEEQKKLKEDLSKIREKFLKDLAELKRRHDREVLDLLPPKAAKKAKELVGEIYLD